jgi:hypothetical protein
MGDVSGAELMRHALGVQAYVTIASKGGIRRKKPYRNHFCASGDDVPTWDALVAEGFATKRAGNAITGGDPVYYVTDAGREHALAGLTFKRRWGYGSPVNP